MYAAYDTETFYRKGTPKHPDGIDIKTLGVWNYLRHPKQDIYMLSVVREDGYEFAGHPTEFDWDKLRDCDLVAHNQSFDENVLIRLNEMGQCPDWVLRLRKHCTADMCAYLIIPRSLADACETIFERRVDKNVRYKMNNRYFKDLAPEEQEELKHYALDDARWCLKLWITLNKHWPESEKQISLINRKIGFKGIRVDAPLARKYQKRLSRLRAAAEKKIPWTVHGESPLARNAFFKECESQGLPKPISLAKDSKEFDDWIKEYGVKGICGWARAVGIYRRSNALLKKINTILERIREDGTMPIEYMYCGTGVTARFSGAGGINMQNLSREPIFTVDLRRVFVP